MNQTAESARAAEKLAVVILGMHRSGTSAISRSISFFGFEQASDANRHWESLAAVHLDHRILRDLGARWSSPGPFVAPGADIAHTRLLLKDRLLDRYADDTDAALETAFGQQPKIVLKDPRMCRVWELWDHVLLTRGYSNKYVIAVRNPIEVARSLEKRDGFNLQKSLRLWLQHNLAALDTYRTGKSVHLIHYEDFLFAPKDTLEAAFLGLEVAARPDASAIAELQQFVQADQRHHVSSIDELDGSASVSKLAKEMYSVLRNWSAIARDEKSRLCEQWQTAFDAACLTDDVDVSGSSAGAPSAINRGTANADNRPHVTKVGQTTFYYAKTRIKEPVLKDVAMTTKRLQNAYVSKRLITTDSSTRDLHISAAVYDSEGKILPEFSDKERIGPTREIADNPKQLDRQRISSAQAMAGTYVYIGTLYKHFGRFLAWTLARAWYLRDMPSDVGILAHSDQLKSKGGVPPFVTTTLELLGIEPRRLVVVDRDMRVETLIVPSAQFMIHKLASPGFCAIFDHLRERVIDRARPIDDAPKKIYLTRRKYNEVLAQRIRAHAQRRGSPQPDAAAIQRLEAKIATNEESIEAVFAARGFEVIAPETLPLADQIRIIGNASHVAGLSGTALHMILFNNKPDTKLIEVGARHIYNQQLINDARKVAAYHIGCVAHRSEQQRPELDVALIEKTLDEIV